MGFSELIEEADDDAGTRAVIVTAVDPVFSAGVDFKEVAAGSGVARRPTNPGATLRAATTPVVCAVNGACVTGALEIALSCTFIVASERARFADTHARLDVVAAWGLTALLPRCRRRAQGGRAVDHRQLRRRRRGAAPRAGQPRRARTTSCCRSPARWSTTSPRPPRSAEVLDLYRRGDGLPLADALRARGRARRGRSGSIRRRSAPPVPRPRRGGKP